MESRPVIQERTGLHEETSCHADSMPPVVVPHLHHVGSEPKRD